MSTSQEIFARQADLVRRACDLLESRINEIETIEKGRVSSSLGDADKYAMIGVFKVKSLRLYKDTLSFISSELVKDDPKIHYFLLPHTRTLLDVYARFLHLLDKCPDENSQALTCFAYQMLTYKVLKSEALYKEGLLLSKDFLGEILFDFPDDPAKLTFG